MRPASNKLRPALAGTMLASGRPAIRIENTVRVRRQALGNHVLGFPRPHAVPHYTGRRVFDGSGHVAERIFRAPLSRGRRPSPVRSTSRLRLGVAPGQPISPSFATVSKLPMEGCNCALPDSPGNCWILASAKEIWSAYARAVRSKWSPGCSPS